MDDRLFAYGISNNIESTRYDIGKDRLIALRRYHREYLLEACRKHQSRLFENALGSQKQARYSRKIAGPLSDVDQICRSSDQRFDDPDISVRPRGTCY